MADTVLRMFVDKLRLLDFHVFYNMYQVQIGKASYLYEYDRQNYINLLVLVLYQIEDADGNKVYLTNRCATGKILEVEKDKPKKSSAFNSLINNML